MLAQQWLLVLGSVGLSAIAQLMLKLGASGVTTPSLGTILSSPWTLGGLGIYALGTLLWLRVLAEMHLSQAYPFVALAIALTGLLGIWLLGEPLKANRVAGSLLIALGVIVVGWR